MTKLKNKSKIKPGRPLLCRPLFDEGTAELRKKRRQLLQTNNTENLALAESLLGIFYARGHISPSLYETGRFFGELGYKFASCLGHSFQPRTSVLILNRKGIPNLTDAFIEKHTRAWYQALNALKNAGPEPYRVVLKIVFYDGNFFEYGIPSSLIKTIPYLRIGLETLESYFKEGLKDKRGKPSDRVPCFEKATKSQLLLKVSQPAPPF